MRGHPTKTARRVALGAATVAACTAFAAPASAGIGVHGPVTPAFGNFPEWYEDASGTRLELCLDGPNCLATAERDDPNAPVSFPDNFPVEGFWWAGETTIGGRVPVNPSGGLACFGEAVPAQALAQVCEVTWQLRGQADGRQVEGARVGITANQGLFGHGSSVLLST